MTIDEAIDILEEVKELDDSIYQYNIKYLKAFEMAIKSLEAWNNLFKSYEVLVDSITDLTATEATERIDEWCIEQLRGILGDYYADRMEKEILEAQADGDDYKYIKSISNPTGIKFDIDIPKKIESYKKLLKHPVVKSIMDMDETQEQLDFVQSHKRIPVTLAVGSGDLISRRALQEWIKDKSFGDIVVASEHNFDCLSSIKPQLCEDAISRQAIMDYIHRILNQGTGKKKSFEFIQKYVTNMPSVKPQTGHWIDREEYDADRWECSECGRTEQYKENYCPSCGARMESEKNE